MAKADADHAARLAGHKSVFRRLLERWRAPDEELGSDLHSSQGSSDDPGKKPFSPAPPSTVKPSEYLEPVKLLLSSGTAIVAVSGAALYAIVAFGYQRFYGDLGVAPHDVGISQTDIIAQAAIALAYLGAITIFLLLFLHLLFAFLPEHTEWWLFVVEWLVIILVVAAALIFFIPVLRAPLGVVLTIAGVTFVSILAGFATRPPARRPRWIRWTRVQSIEALILGLATLFLLGLHFTIARADALGNMVSAGYTFAPGARLTLILDVRADPACVSTLSTSSKSQLMYYLGNSGDWDVLYDPEAQKTVSRSRSDLELAFIPYQYWANGSAFISYKDLKGFCQ
jgi:hypothetical protein